jgi:hypothetical protein
MSNSPPRTPPKKKEGMGTGPRRLNGAVLGVREAAAFLGTTEKTLRGLIARQLVPFHRLSSRIILLRSELASFLAGLPGCTPDEARANQAVRQ